MQTQDHNQHQIQTTSFGIVPESANTRKAPNNKTNQPNQQTKFTSNKQQSNKSIIHKQITTIITKTTNQLELQTIIQSQTVQLHQN